MKLFQRAVKFLCPTFYKGGGGGPSTSTSTVYQRNIPPELAPYYELLLNATTKQMFTSAGNPDPNPTPKLQMSHTRNAADYTGGASAPNIDMLSKNTKNYAKGGEIKGYDDGGTTATTAAGAAQQAATTAGFGDITGMFNYVPYGSTGDGNWDASKSVAPFDPLQQATYNQFLSGNITTPSLDRSKAATDMASLGLGTQASLANQFGQAGYQAGQNAALIGNAASDTAQANATSLGNTGLAAGLGGGHLYGTMGSDYGAAGMSIGTQGANLGVTGGSLYGSQGAGYGQAASNLGVAAGNLGVSQGAQVYGAGADLANRAALSGQQYENKATSSDAVGAYMNPYLQQSLKPSLDLLQQQNDITKQKNNSAAAQAAAYGGSRQTVQNALTDQGNALSTAQLIGQGYNAAYDKAQGNILAGSQLGQAGLGLANQSLGTAMQGTSTGLAGLNQAISGQQAGMQGAGLGLQGVSTQLSGIDRGLAGVNAGQQGAQIGLSGVDRALAGVNTGINAGQYGLQGAQVGIQGQQAAMQGAGVGLSGVGAAQGAYQGIGQMAQQRANLQGQDLSNQLNVLNAYNTMGQQAQAREQQIIDNQIAMNDYLQNRPMQMLGQFGNILNGVQATGTTEFRPAPNAMAQTLGTAGSLAGIIGSLRGGKKKGGAIKLAEGGQVGGIGDLAVYNALNGIGR